MIRSEILYNLNDVVKGIKVLYNKANASVVSVEQSQIDAIADMMCEIQASHGIGHLEFHAAEEYAAHLLIRDEAEQRAIEL